MSYHLICYSASEVAKVTGLGLSTIRKLTRCEKIPHVKIGRRIVYPVSALNDWLFANTFNEKSEKGEQNED